MCGQDDRWRIATPSGPATWSSSMMADKEKPKKQLEQRPRYEEIEWTDEDDAIMNNAGLKLQMVRDYCPDGFKMSRSWRQR